MQRDILSKKSLHFMYSSKQLTGVCICYVSGSQMTVMNYDRANMITLGMTLALLCSAQN